MSAFFDDELTKYKGLKFMTKKWLFGVFFFWFRVLKADGSYKAS